MHLDASADDGRNVADEAVSESDQRSRSGQSEMLLRPISRVNYKPFL